MRWERQKPLRPLLAALGLLFLLVLAAPSSWQGQEAQQAGQVNTAEITSTGGDTMSSELMLSELTLESAAPELAAPTLAATEPELAFPELVIAAPEAPLPEQSILLPLHVEVAEALPVRKEFDLKVLRKVRDSLLAVLDQLPAVEQPVPAIRWTRPQMAPVRVSNASDRLAMVVPRRPSPAASLPVTKPASQLTPKLPVETTKEEVADFAAVLLEASRQSKVSGQRSIVVPQLARRVKITPAPTPVSHQEITSVTPATPTPELAAVPTTTYQTPTFQAPATRVPALPTPALEPVVVTPQLSQFQPMELPVVVEVPAVVVKPSPPVLTHRPKALIKQLNELTPRSPGAVWAQQVLGQLQKLTEKSTDEQFDVAETMHRLEQLHAAGLRLSEHRTLPTFHNPWEQAAEALGRRLVLWQMLLDPEQEKVVRILPTEAESYPDLDSIAELLEQQENGWAWRDYLLLDRIAAATSESLATPELVRAKLAQEVLSRMTDSRLTVTQIAFLKREPLVELQLALRPWAAGRVNLETLAAIIERYESGREMRYGTVIAQLQQRLTWSEDPRLQALAVQLDESYRGANMRIAMSDDLLNRMMPKQKEIITPVSDSIAGAKVFGSARTTTQLRISLVPDAEAWHFGLLAHGKVYSDTRSDTWPARIRNAAKMQYEARKEITLDPQGLHSTPTQATAKGRNELIGVDSKMDSVPVLGHLLRDMARKKHKKSRPVALTQAKAKVVRQAKSRMDETLDKKLETFEQKFRDKVLAPMEQLALLAEPLDMHTTEGRAVMQLRLANSGQLAAHTLRPFAPSDSVLSVQMHESALNNAMMGFGLDGRRMTMLELFEFFANRFGKAGAAPPADMPSHAVIEFAKRDSVRVQCEGDRLELILSVKELAHRRDKIKNFQIHVHFRPQLEGMEVRLVRDGSLQFSGRRLKTGPRFVLHSILGKILAEDLAISVINEELMEDPRLKGLMVTQLVIEDGWIGLALGPAHLRRTALRSPRPEFLGTPFVR